MSDIKQYIDLRLKEAKLSAADGLSKILSQIISIFIVAILAIVVLVLLALALMQWLNKPGMLGEPWGTVVACGAIIAVMAVIFLLRNKLFHKSLGKSISDAFGIRSENIDDSISSVKSEIYMSESQMMDTSGGLVDDIVGSVTQAVSAFRKIRDILKGRV